MVPVIPGVDNAGHMSSPAPPERVARTAAERYERLLEVQAVMLAPLRPTQADERVALLRLAAAQPDGGAKSTEPRVTGSLALPNLSGSRPRIRAPLRLGP